VAKKIKIGKTRDGRLKVKGRGVHMTHKAKERKRAHREEYGQSAYTPEVGKAFCTILASTCNVGKAAGAVGVTRMTVYNWREQFKEFAEEWDAAKQIGLTVLEDEAVRRGGTDGVDEPVFYKGKLIDTVKKHSDTLLTFLISAHKPDTYGKQRLEHSGKDGAPLTPMRVEVVFPDAPKEQKKK